ncbi:zinc ribbon domain-containing protein [Lactobacillus terrae]|uniref:zinc ribbon domain-containing protein n=1 Tax=Lactobacillus terrae TaxID=2269374 RepID=UPI000C1B64C4|nr:zinc ribbon domain-containing protein [Lactobacillus terrae]
MVCPNCGHPITAEQKFCDNCGLPLKKGINNKQDDKTDSVVSLSALEEELAHENDSQKVTSEPVKTILQQAPAQKMAQERSKQQNHNNPNPDLDATRAFVPNDFNSNKKVHLEAEPTKENTATPENTNEDSGLIKNMWNFATANGYISLFTVVIAAVLMLVRRNYGYVFIAAAVIAWFLFAQISHGKETSINKRFKQDKPKKQKNNNDSAANDYQNGEQHIEEIKVDRKRSIYQKISIVLAIIGLIASVTGPFLNGVSITNIITNVYNVGVNLGINQATAQNITSALRLICFISPMIIIMFVGFNSKFSIRMVKIFSFLPTVIYIIIYVIFATHRLDANIFTGNPVLNSPEFGFSYYILLATSLITFVFSFTIHRKIKKQA